MSNVCIFSSQYLPHMGGVERYTYNLARYLIRRGDRVTVVTSRIPGTKAHEVSEGIEIFRLPCLDLMNGRYPVLKPVGEFFRLHKKLMAKEFDLVMVNTRFYIHSVYGAFFARRKGVRCIMVDHGTSHLNIHSRVGNLAVQGVEHLLTVFDKLLCREFYGVSQACCEWIRHFHIQARGTLYNAVDLEEIEEVKQRKLTDFREKYQIPEDGTVIGFTGRLLKEKGILQLVDAVKKLREEGQKVFLLIAGDGDERETIENRSGEGIFLLGRLEFEEVIGMLKQTDIFCLPSDSEGFSTSILEAAACGCYIVTTERGGAKEMLLDPSYGMIIRKNDTETVTEALRRVLPKEEYRRKAASKTYQRLKENYTWEITAERVHRLAEGQKLV